MRQNYVVQLSDEDRRICDETVDKLKGSSQEARRARILSQLDVDGSGWCDRQVAEAFCSHVRTVENVRRRCVLEGFRQSDLVREHPAIVCSWQAHWEEIVPFLSVTDTFRKTIFATDHSACCTSCGHPQAGGHRALRQGLARPCRRRGGSSGHS